MNLIRIYFCMKSGHILERQGVCSMNKKEHILVNLGQFEDESLLNIMEI